MVHVILWPRSTDIRVLVLHGDRRTPLLEATLPEVAHPRAARWWLEALAMWLGQPIRAVLVADDLAGSCATSLCRAWLPGFDGPRVELRQARSWDDIVEQLDLGSAS